MFRVGEISRLLATLRCRIRTNKDVRGGHGGERVVEVEESSRVRLLRELVGVMFGGGGEHVLSLDPKLPVGAVIGG